MSEKMSDKQPEEKGLTWIYFISLLQLGDDRKVPEQKRENLRDAIATATSDVDSMF